MPTSRRSATASDRPTSAGGAVGAPAAGALVLAVLALASSLAHAEPGPAAAGRCLRHGAIVMGTVLQVTVCGEGAVGAAERILAEAAREEAIFSRYQSSSAVSALAARAGRPPRSVPPELLDVLRRAERLRRLTRGAFDVTVGPLVDLWRGATSVPSPGRIERVRALVGALVLTADGRVGLPRPGMSVDLGGIAKGYALDRAAAGLHGASALLDFGQSSFRAIGRPPDGPTWNLIVRGPGGDAIALVALRDRALSVSASFGRSREIEGRRFGHVIDPRTGHPVSAERVAAVVATSATEAEGLSTALVVAGREGLAAVEQVAGAEALLVERRRGAARRRWRTSGWREAVAGRVAPPASAGGRRLGRDEDGAELPRGIGRGRPAELG